jgi:hypothetical protein
MTDLGAAGRASIHMNPKVFDYNSSPVSQSMIFLYQVATTSAPPPCVLPDNQRYQP